MDYANYEALRIERHQRVLTITLDNPPMNAISRPMHTELARLFQDINRDPEVAVVVITGAGTRAFSAGGDIQRMRTRIEENAHHEWVGSMREAKEIVYGLLRLERPLIARINGHAMGLGATLSVLSDFGFMLDSAKIADTHVKVGLTAGDGGALMWPILIGFARARHYLLTGDTMTGKEAAEMGLIHDSAPAIKALDAKVDALVNRLLDSAPAAINGTKASINLLLRKMLEGVMEAHLGIETQTYLSKDHYRAAVAFTEKETPIFEGN